MLQLNSVPSRAIIEKEILNTYSPFDEKLYYNQIYKEREYGRKKKT